MRVTKTVTNEMNEILLLKCRNNEQPDKALELAFP